MRSNREISQPGRGSALTGWSHRSPSPAGHSGENREPGNALNDLFAPAATTSRRAPVFTLGSSLRWLGHDCPDDRCFRVPINTLGASVWFLRRGPQSRPFPAETRVLIDAIDIGDTVTAIRRMIYHINGCTRRDAIEVRYKPRCADDRFKREVPRRMPVALLTRYQPALPDEMSGPSENDLRVLTEATRW